MLTFKATYCIDTRVWQCENTNDQSSMQLCPLYCQKNQSIAKHTKPVAIQVWGKNTESESRHLNRRNNLL